MLLLSKLHVGSEVVGIEEHAVPVEQQVEEFPAPTAVGRALRHILCTLHHLEVKLSRLCVT